MDVKDNIAKAGTITVTVDRKETVELWYALHVLSIEYASRLRDHPDERLTIEEKQLCNEMFDTLATLLRRDDWKNNKHAQESLLLEEK